MISIFNTSDKATLSKQIEQYKQEIQRSLEFVKNIEQGNLDVEYEGFDKENDTKNHLAVALVSMRDHMKVIAEHEKQRNWVTPDFRTGTPKLKIEQFLQVFLFFG